MFKMYNGIDSSYLTVDISPNMPQNCSSDQSYFLNDSHKSPSKELAGSDSFESPVSSMGSPDLKSNSNIEDSFINNNLDKKSMKILQRPSTARSTEGRLHLDTEALYVNQYARRGHRKKTLSLNPEEREALESLIEDVIIVGLDDAAIDSEDSSDENNENEKNACSDSTNDKQSPKFMGDNKEFSDKFSNQRENLKNRTKVNHVFNARLYGNNMNKDMLRRHNVNNGKDIFRMNFNKNNVNNVNSNIKDFTKNRDIHFLNNINKLNKEQQTPKKNYPSAENHQKGNFQEENLDNGNKNSVSGMLGINIYPAQLKVAIKHMDSLPPRFLRRLQTGQNRISGSEPALQSLSELNLSVNGKESSPYGPLPSRLTTGLDTGPSPGGSAEKDRSKSKQIHLEETKKIIRNLLSDLDQYTDEGVTTPGMKDISPFNPPPFQEAKMAYDFKPPMPNPVILSPNSIFRMPHTRFNSESQLNTLDLPLPANPQVSHRGFSSYSNDAFRSREFNSLDVAHGSTGYLNLSPKQPNLNYDSQGMYFVNDHSGSYPLSFQKKTNLKVDAPIFVSNQFQAKQNAPTTTKSQHVEAKSNDNSIAFLPGVLNVDVNQQQQANHNNKKQQQLQQQQPQQQMMNPNISRNNSPYLFKMGSMYPPMPLPPPLSNGMIPSHPQAGLMRMVNFATPPPYPPAVPYNNFYGGNSMFIRPDYQSGHHQAFQPWVSINNSDLPPGETPQLPWFPHNYHHHPSHHPTMEGPAPPPPPQFVDHPTQMDDEQDWNNSMNYCAGDMLETYPVELGRQRVMQMLNEGMYVMVILVGNPQGDKLSKLQMNMSGVFVLNLHTGPPGPNLSSNKLKEQREWNFKQVAEALSNHKSLVIIDHTYAQAEEMHQCMYMAQFHGYEVIIINGCQKYSEVENNPSLFMGGDYKMGPPINYPYPMVKQDMGVLEFPTNNA